jgi:hypothetical protein
VKTVKEYEDNITYILENWIPRGCVVRVREGFGPEDFNKSLAASISKMMDFYGIPQSQEVRANMASKVKFLDRGAIQ